MEPVKSKGDIPSALRCIYPGCDGGPPSAFCDREDHNALTAHQERVRLEKERG
jgi:hypothetical protein